MSEEYDTHIEDDGGPQIIVVDGEGPQGLWVRVGPIYNKDSEDAPEVIDTKPGVWVEYQDPYMQGPLQGPILIPADTWDELDTWVRDRIASFNRKVYEPLFKDEEV